MFFFAVFLLPSYVHAILQLAGKQVSEETHKSVTAPPDLSEIILLATNLSGRLADLKNHLKQSPDGSDVEKKYDAIADDVEGLASEFKKLNEVDEYNIANFHALKQAVASNKTLIAETSDPLKNEIRRIGRWKAQWSSEKKRWNEYQFNLLDEQAPEQLKTSFSKAASIIDTGLELVQQHLEIMLALQAEGGDLSARIDVIDSNVRALISGARHDFLLAKSSPIFSHDFLFQLFGGTQGVALNTCPASSSSRHDHTTLNSQSKPRPRAGVRGLRR